MNESMIQILSQWFIIAVANFFWKCCFIDAILYVVFSVVILISYICELFDFSLEGFRLFPLFQV